MQDSPQDNSLKLQIIQAILRQAQTHNELAQRHYNIALTITGFSLLFSFTLLSATASGKLSDKALSSLIGALPLTCCIQLTNAAGKQLTASSQQLNQLLDDL